MSLFKAATLVGSLASTVAAHGFVSGIVAGGVYYEGYNPSFQYQSPRPNVIGWSDPADLSNGFVSDYTSPDIICHLNATNAGSHAPIAAGDQIEFQWTAWPSSHHGPVITYLANCNGPCESVDKTTLEFFKIDAVGLINDATVPGDWGSDALIANNNSWVSQIPSDIAPGNYVVRHEIIALHSAGTAGGAQNYPQCMNLEITGTGTAAPSGVLGEALYSTSAPGLLINIYQSLSTYDMPGPTLISGATVLASQTPVATKSIANLGVTGSGAAPAPATSAAAATTAAPATSAAASPSVTSAAAVASTSAAAPVSSAAASSSSEVSLAEASVSAASFSAPIATASVPGVFPPSPASGSGVVAPFPTAFSTGVASLTSALPSSFLTSAISTAVPTVAPVGFGNGTLPTTPLPQGMTFRELLNWVNYLFAEYFSEHRGESKFRAHPRDVKYNKA